MRFIGCLSLILAVGCQTTNHAQRGALLGGLSGAGIGAAVGSSNDETAAGALIGGALGAFTGGAIGDGMDEIDARNQALIEQSIGRRLRGATTIADAIAMSRSGLGDAIIIQHMQANGIAASLSAEDLITLKQQGVSDGVISAMQSIASAPPVALARYEEPVYVPRPRVVVRERYYGRPCPPPYWRYHWRPPPCGPPGLQWGVTFRN